MSQNSIPLLNQSQLARFDSLFCDEIIGLDGRGLQPDVSLLEPRILPNPPEILSLGVGKRSRNWFGTFNNPHSIDILSDWFDTGKFRWIVGQLERGANGTPHIQFTCAFKDDQSFNSAKKALDPRVHLEPTKSVAEAIAYCSKEDSRIEGPLTFGKPPKQTLDKTLKALDAVKLTHNDLGQLSLSQFIQVQKVKEIYQKISPPIFSGPRTSTWISGQPGSGKSRYVKTMAPFQKPLSKWWDGYEQESIVLLDDFEIDTLKYLAHYLKLWADPYGLLFGEVKGSKVSLNFSQLYITSNYTIDECCQHCFPADEQLRQALKRRFAETTIDPQDGLMYPL